MWFSLINTMWFSIINTLHLKLLSPPLEHNSFLGIFTVFEFISQILKKYFILESYKINKRNFSSFNYYNPGLWNFEFYNNLITAEMVTMKSIEQETYISIVLNRN